MMTVVLKPKREHSLLRRHPWIFSGAVARVEGNPGPGDTVRVVASDAAPLAVGAYSPASQIAVRVWSFDPDEPVDGDFFRRRLEAALRRRDGFSPPDGAGRLVYSESDGLPGIIVDRYRDALACAFLSAGAERWKREVADALRGLGAWSGLYERSEADARTKEGLPAASGELAEAHVADEIDIVEAGCRFRVNVREGQKTGFYLDQSRNRPDVGAMCAGREVLDGFAYTGGFAIHALRAGAARVTAVEASGTALSIAARHAALNEVDAARIEAIEGDMFHVLRRFRDEGRSFDAVILDPPKFADSAGHVARAARGYKDINLLAIKLLRPGGLLCTFSCSGLLAPDLFQKIVADAALDAKRNVQLLRRIGQASDHPTLLSFPEATYLKGLVCRAD